MTDRDLLTRAIKAGMAYWFLYSIFPRKIGIHWQRLRAMPQSSLVFPKLLPSLSLILPQELCDLAIELHSVPLEGIRGVLIDWDEVYFPFWGPRDTICLISAETLFRREADQKRKADA